MRMALGLVCGALVLSGNASAESCSAGVVCNTRYEACYGDRSHPVLKNCTYKNLVCTTSHQAVRIGYCFEGGDCNTSNVLRPGDGQRVIFQLDPYNVKSRGDFSPGLRVTCG